VPGQQQTVEFLLTSRQMSFADNSGNWVLEPGDFQVWVGGQQPDLKAATQPANVVGGKFIVH
jgi:beta-glucosidase